MDLTSGTSSEKVQRDYFHEPPCPCAQQLVGMLFGWITGIITMILLDWIPATVVTMVIPHQNYRIVWISAKHSPFIFFTQSLGVAFGSLGSEHESPLSIKRDEFLVLFVLCVIVTAVIMPLFGEPTIVSLLFLSVVTSSLSMPVKIVMRIYQITKMESENGKPNVQSCLPVWSFKF